MIDSARFSAFNLGFDYCERRMVSIWDEGGGMNVAGITMDPSCYTKTEAGDSILLSLCFLSKSSFLSVLVLTSVALGAAALAVFRNNLFAASESQNRLTAWAVATLVKWWRQPGFFGTSRGPPTHFGDVLPPGRRNLLSNLRLAQCTKIPSVGMRTLWPWTALSPDALADW